MKGLKDDIKIGTSMYLNRKQSKPIGIKTNIKKAKP